LKKIVFTSIGSLLLCVLMTSLFSPEKEWKRSYFLPSL
jgi:hypothetical protein